MRRPLSALSDAARGWNAFFFSLADPTPLALIRIVTGSLLLWSLGITGLDLHAALGSEAWADPQTVRAMLNPGAWSIWLNVPDALLRPTWVVAMIVLTLFTLGLFSRWMAPLAWIIVVSTSRRMPTMLFGFDGIIATWTFYLAVCGASGHALSLDRWLARRRANRAGRPLGPPEPTIAANLGLRLIQLHLCLIYGMAGLAKLQSASWWNGSAIGKLLGNSEFRPFDLTWLATDPAAEYVLNLATHLALWTEIGYAVLIWVRGLRPLVLLSVVMMHLGIALTMGLT
ncbi:MAG: thiol-disulfide oxidoreductase, partial [Isosphaeraceae bacterium]